MKLVVVRVGDRGGGLVMEAGAGDVLDGDSRRSGKLALKFECELKSSSKRASLNEITFERILIGCDPPSVMAVHKSEFLGLSKV